MKIDTKVGNVSLEQGLLVFALVLLAGAAFYKAFTYGAAGKAIAPRAAAMPPLKDPTQFADVAKGLNEVPVVKPREHKLFIPRLTGFYPKSGEIRTLDWKEVMDDGITPEWKQKYKFELGDPTVAGGDPDADGYSNKEEFDANTDPRDKASAPPVINKLFVKSYTPRQLQIIFKGYNELSDQPGVFEYQINTPTLARRSWRLKEGEMINVDEFNKYVIGKFRKNVKMVINPRTDAEELKDFSELDVMDPRLNEVITLLFNTPQDSDQSTVGFELEVPGEAPEPPDVQIGKKFKVRGTEYQLRRMGDNGAAIILDLKTQKEVIVPKVGGARQPAPAAGEAPAPVSAPAAGAPAVTVP